MQSTIDMNGTVTAPLCKPGYVNDNLFHVNELNCRLNTTVKLVFEITACFLCAATFINTSLQRGRNKTQEKHVVAKNSEGSAKWKKISKLSIQCCAFVSLCLNVVLLSSLQQITFLPTALWGLHTFFIAIALFSSIEVFVPGLKSHIANKTKRTKLDFTESNNRLHSILCLLITLTMLLTAVASGLFAERKRRWLLLSLNLICVSVFSILYIGKFLLVLGRIIETVSRLTAYHDAKSAYNSNTPISEQGSKILNFRRRVIRLRLIVLLFIIICALAPIWVLNHGEVPYFVYYSYINFAFIAAMLSRRFMLKPKPKLIIKAITKSFNSLFDTSAAASSAKVVASEMPVIAEEAASE